ncbi:MAG: hypothetical protein ACKO4M_06930, partial [Betaproteobacteria bacterium]
LPAEARVAKFLLSISQKFRGMGFSDKSFHLRMTREDIGSIWAHAGDGEPHAVRLRPWRVYPRRSEIH